VQVSVFDAVDDVQSIVGGVGDIKPVRGAMYGGVIEAAGLEVPRQFDVQ
jgi:hypothetical protein